MKTTLIRYKTKPQSTDENERLIQAVFAELKASAPTGVRYQVTRLPDGSFNHLVEVEDGSNALTALTAFKAFQEGVKDRCVEPPQAQTATLVGRYP